jgi:hypothetical protein
VSVARISNANLDQSRSAEQVPRAAPQELAKAAASVRVFCRVGMS